MKQIQVGVIVAITLLSFSANAQKTFIANGDVTALITAIDLANQNNKPDTLILALRGTYVFTDPIASVYEGNSALPDVKLDQALTNKVVIYGNGATLARDAAAPAFRIWMVFGGSLELHDVVIKNGKLNGNPGMNGAGIHNVGELTIYNSSFINNSASFLGGALYIGVSSPTSLTNCTITGNIAASGAAIYFYSGNASLTNCTVVANTSTTANGTGLHNALTLDDPNQRIFIKNSIVALNANSSGVQNDLSGVMISLGHNLVGVNKDPNAQTYMPSGTPNYLSDYVGTAVAPIDPLVNALATNGGLTPTISIQQSSLAFNNGGQAVNVIATDQGGNNRIGNPEIGSLEFNNNPILSPGIAVAQGTTNIANAGQYDFGDVINGNNSAAALFKIKNTGFSLALNLLSNPRIFVTGSSKADFALDQTLTSGSISGNGETSFRVAFSPKTAGSKSVMISIASNDTGIPVFSFQLIGNSIAAPPSIDTGLTVTAASPICEGDDGEVIVISSETGVDYQLFNGNVAVGDAIAGDGDLVMPVLSGYLSVGDNQLKILGVRAGVGSDTLTMQPILHVYPTPTISTQPMSDVKATGQSMTFTIAASGASLTYHWRKGTTPLIDNARTSGTATSSMTISNTSVDDSGDYNCVVNSLCGNIISSEATLAVESVVTGIKDPFEGSATLYPNPTHGTVTIENSEAEKVSLIDLRGHIIREWYLDEMSPLDLNEVSPGIYVLTGVRQGRVLFRNKLIKE